MASTAAPGRPLDPQPVRLWLLLLSAPAAYAVGSAVLADYGAESGIVAALTYFSVIGGYAIFGARARTWLAARRWAAGAVFGLFTFVTLVSLHVFTPAEDVVVAIAAGVAAASLIDGS